VEIHLVGSVGMAFGCLSGVVVAAPGVTAFRKPGAGLIRHRWGRFPGEVRGVYSLPIALGA